MRQYQKNTELYECVIDYAARVNNPEAEKRICEGKRWHRLAGVMRAGVANRRNAKAYGKQILCQP